MIWIKNKIIPFKGFNAITIWPFVFFKQDSITMRNHEKIHGRQQLEVGTIFGAIVYYIWYFIEYRIRYRRYRKEGVYKKTAKYRAYYYLAFEREAYLNQRNYNYLKIMNVYSWVKYLH